MIGYSIRTLLSKLDYRLSSTAVSRAQYQARLVMCTLNGLNHRRWNVLDVGGGFNANYKSLVAQVAKKYINLEIKKGPGVDIIGSVYSLPMKGETYNLILLFMVMEHLAEPEKALKECNRVLKRNGYIGITTVQYWHTHNHPSDYYRYTKSGLEYLLKKSGFKIVSIWSHGGPFLVAFHSVELNLPDPWRTIYSILFYRLMDYLDWLFFKHYDKRKPNSDSVGWSVVAKKI